MKKDWKYILYISAAFGLFVAVRMFSPKQYDWTITLAHDDKNPFGTYALNEVLPDLFPNKEIHHSYLTLYELKDSLHRMGNIFIITQNFGPQMGAEDPDAKALLNHVNEGGTAFISANYFGSTLSDTLNLNTADYMFNNILKAEDSLSIHFANPALDTLQRFKFKSDVVHNYFTRFDTTRTTIVAKNEEGDPVTIRVSWGKGSLILNTTPVAFTNIYLLMGNKHDYIAKTLSYLPQNDIEWTEFYHLGRREAQTPLRVILTTEPLAWAYYLTITTLLLFMLFEMKRKQRIIPIQPPLANTTLEFVGTIGNLYYQSQEHKNVAMKRIAFLLENIRTKYYISTQLHDPGFIKTLSRKTGHTEESLFRLFTLIDAIQHQHEISTQQLMELNKQIDAFNTALK